MATVYYPAIVERTDAGYSVFFPDLPGCTSAGRTVQEAARNAEEALSAHLILSAEHGDSIAAPSELDAIEHDAEVDEAARILVRAERPGKAIRLNVTLDEGLVAEIDRVAKNRSGFLAEAARAALSGNVVARGVAAGIIGQGQAATMNVPDFDKLYVRKDQFAQAVGVEITSGGQVVKRPATRHG